MAGVILEFKIYIKVEVAPVKMFYLTLMMKEDFSVSTLI